MIKKIRYGKKEFTKTFIGIVLILFVVRLIFPSLTHDKFVNTRASQPAVAQTDTVIQHAIKADSLLEAVHELPQDLSGKPSGRKHRILSVSSFDRTFPDLNDVQLATAEKIGIKPLDNRAETAKANYEKLVYAGSSPYYAVKKLHNSIPYLIPRAQLLLNHIGRTFIDSLMIKNIRPSKIIVTSFTRTEEDIKNLQRYNPNATDKSCHCRGTTFDISYSKYAAIHDPDSIALLQTRDDTLKWVLSEVLRDLRQEGLCYIKYEVKQGCFHITVR